MRAVMSQEVCMRVPVQFLQRDREQDIRTLSADTGQFVSRKPPRNPGCSGFGPDEQYAPSIVSHPVPPSAYNFLRGLELPA
jgi:hypothetical protein